MPQPNDLSKSLAALDQDSTLIAVVEMSQSSWLVAGIIPGIERHPAKKLEASETLLLSLLHRWREEAAKAGRTITRTAVAFEAGRDGLWLAPHGSSRWAEDSRLWARGIEAHVIHATSIAVSREHRRAKTDRLDAGLLKRAFLGCPSTSSGARRTGPLQHGCDSQSRGGGRQAAEPGTGKSGWRAYPHRQPDQERARAPWHSRLQTGFARACPGDGRGRRSGLPSCACRKGRRCRPTRWPS
jgi:hypothetical protein